MQKYDDALRTVLQQGHESTDRTGTISHFGLQCRYRLSDGFPLVTTKKLHLNSMIHELLWFCRATRTSLSAEKRRLDLGRMGG